MGRSLPISQSCKVTLAIQNVNDYPESFRTRPAVVNLLRLFDFKTIPQSPFLDVWHHDAMHSVQQALLPVLPVDNIHCWSDSQVALGWINRLFTRREGPRLPAGCYGNLIVNVERGQSRPKRACGVDPDRHNWATFTFTIIAEVRSCCTEMTSSKARHEADSFEPAAWSERLTPGQSGWLGVAAVGSIPALALSLFLQRLNFLLFLQRLYLSLRAVRSAAMLLFVLRRFVLAASSACFFPFFLPPPNPQSTCQSERTSKAHHEADSFEPAEWSERLTPRQSGWLGAAAVGSIPALALSLFLQY